MNERERYYAEPFKNKLGFFQFINYFWFIGCSYSGPMLEFRKIDDCLNFREDIAKMPKYGNYLPAVKRLG